MSYIQKTFRPQLINGDVSSIIQANGSDKAFAAGDILFDWVAVDVPIGTDCIVDGIIHMYGEDGGAQNDADLNLLIAHSDNSVAPASLGSVNNGVTGCYDLPDILTGMMKFEGGANRAGKLDLAFGTIYHFNGTGNNGQHGPVAINPEYGFKAGGKTTNRIYVAGIAGGGIDFSTGVLADGAVTDNAATSITVKTVDPRKAFRVGDTVYLHDVDTALGTIASMTATNITLNAAIAGGTDIADNDEFVNDTPITVTLTFCCR